jgi:hypothetical protein
MHSTYPFDSLVPQPENPPLVNIGITVLQATNVRKKTHEQLFFHLYLSFYAACSLVWDQLQFQI